VRAGNVSLEKQEVQSGESYDETSFEAFRTIKVCLGLLLTASPGLAQSKLARGMLRGHGLASAPAVPVSRPPRNGVAYNFTFIDFPRVSC
jgi:hypothetical protein